MSLKSAVIIALILLLLTGMASASLTAPTTYSIGYKIWGKYHDMMGENGIRNGTIGGVGNNVTFLDGSGTEITASPSVTYTVVNVTSNYTIGASNVSGSFYTVYANTGTLNVTLPVMSGVANGTFYNIKKKDASTNSVNINVTSAGTIDGALWQNLTSQGDSVTVVRADTEWSII